MDIKTGRANHIEDVLVKLHTGQWFGWEISGSNYKVYENLIIHDDSYDKPTSASLELELRRMQEEFDGKTYRRNRLEGVSGSYAASQGTGSRYPAVTDQLDMLFHELETSGSLTTSGSWFKAVKAVKDANPKPE